MLGVLFIIIAIIVLLMRNLITPSKNDLVKTDGIGVIKRKIQDGCRVFFYVDFQDQSGNVHAGKSITYRNTKGKYREGDIVNIQYYFSPKGRPFVRIEDPDIVSSEMAAKPMSAVMLIIAIILIIVGVVCLLLGVPFRL